MLPDAKMELPYEGGKKMILVEDVDNRDLLQEHFSDKIFEKDKLPFSVINEADAEIISCEQSRFYTYRRNR